MKEKLFTLGPSDFRVDTFRCSGAGGQNVNKRDTGVRITHLESGASAECRDERQQGQNKKRALRKLTETSKFKTWVRLKAASLLLGFSSVEQRIEQAMAEKNLKIEYLVTYHCDGCTQTKKDVTDLPQGWVTDGEKDFCPTCQQKRIKKDKNETK